MTHAPLVADTALQIWSPWIQLGFAGFCFALLGVIVWLIRKMLQASERNFEAFERNIQVVDRNTAVIEAQATVGTETREMVSDVRDLLLSRPCMAPRDGMAKVQTKGKQ